MDAWTYDKIDEAIKILDEISHSLKRLADYYTPTEKVDTPQTDCDRCIWSVCNYNRVDWDADIPQTERSK